jgi:hypothetical protein
MALKDRGEPNTTGLSRFRHSLAWILVSFETGDHLSGLQGHCLSRRPRANDLMNIL